MQPEGTLEWIFYINTSILAKVERDKYIEDLCKEYPHLDEWYDLLSNKGYGTKAHMDGIKEEILLNHSYNTAQIQWFKAGSAMNVLRNKKHN